MNYLLFVCQGRYVVCQYSLLLLCYYFATTLVLLSYWFDIGFGISIEKVLSFSYYEYSFGLVLFSLVFLFVYRLVFV